MYEQYNHNTVSTNTRAAMISKNIRSYSSAWNEGIKIISTGNYTQKLINAIFLDCYATQTD